jgi:hypothetical protein
VSRGSCIDCLFHLPIIMKPKTVVSCDEHGSFVKAYLPLPAWLFVVPLLLGGLLSAVIFWGLIQFTRLGFL